MDLLADIHRVAAEIVPRVVVDRLIDDAGGSDEADADSRTPAVPASPSRRGGSGLRGTRRGSRRTCVEAAVEAAKAAHPDAVGVGGRGREGETTVSAAIKSSAKRTLATPLVAPGRRARLFPEAGFARIASAS